jgi:hypothetical protein
MARQIEYFHGCTILVGQGKGDADVVIAPPNGSNLKISLPG